MKFVKQLWLFGWQQALSCVFPVIIFATLAISKVITIPYLHRYDVILLICLLAQVAMLKFKLETWDELKVITLFHIIGLMLELYKVHMGSWSYPEEAWTKIGGVPLYSGFMYASVASYLCQAWRRFDIYFHNWPPQIIAISIGACIYLNFFIHHFLMDFRWILIAVLFVAFFRSRVYFTVGKERYHMPVILSYFLVAFFIWVAENISTLLGAWKYPDQMHHWTWVHWGKLTSWFLLVIISFIIVTQLKQIKKRGQNHISVEEPKSLIP
ncbi:hypothetical protein BVG16_15045 [Paenibacillus selenitireducens]|uniref:DUF817 domain-containing protein n=1 Tax=Paenibacillus selenitireducens TaxID=1324314 RepID=A0A1T2XD42_9BACL|nr:DUF817 domain-containing protein [Paenibacillus selenitireducens]OPA77748.1 hypothetical protein BVG16_15045 [Paenibacillus selenitireducens]